MIPMITHIDFYLPNKNFSNSKIIKKKSVKEIISKVGIDVKYAVKDDEFAIDLGLAATKKLINKFPKLKKKIDFIIFCTQSPDNILPTGSARIQSEIFSDKNIGLLDINLGCSGFVYSLSVAESMIISKFAKNVLIITTDTYSKFINEENLSVRTIFGDAASATVVSGKKSKISHTYLPDYGTDGTGIYDLIVPGSGLKKYEIINKEVGIKGLNKKLVKNELFMDGPKMFAFALKAVPVTIKQTLKKNKLKLSEIDLFIFHQANKFMLESIGKKINIPRNKLFISLNKRGNTTSSSIPIAIHDAVKKLKAKNNMKICLCGFGVGLSWATTVINISPILTKNIVK